jgi:hypothetical protein
MGFYACLFSFFILHSFDWTLASYFSFPCLARMLKNTLLPLYACVSHAQQNTTLTLWNTAKSGANMAIKYTWCHDPKFNPQFQNIFQKLIKKKVFDVFWSFLHPFYNLQLFFFYWCHFKKLNSKKYVFNANISGSYFLIVFLIKDVNVI